MVRRGPDKHQRIDKVEQLKHENGCESASTIHITFVGCVLWLRGKCPQSQPLVNKLEDNLLLWNGDVFGGLDILQNDCDTNVLSGKLSDSSTQVPKVISSLQGPFAFVFYESKNQMLWFGRDYFGRHSLLVHKTKDCLILTSVVGMQSTKDFNFVEVPAAGVYQMNLSSFFQHAILELHPYLKENSITPQESLGKIIYTKSLTNVGNPLCTKTVNASQTLHNYKNIDIKEGSQEEILLHLLSNDKFLQVVENFTDLLLSSKRLG